VTSHESSESGQQSSPTQASGAPETLAGTSPSDARTPAPALAKPTLTSVQVSSLALTFSGPLPHPEILAGLEAVVPGAAAHLVDAALSETEVRRTQEAEAAALRRRQTDIDARASFEGRLFGLIAARAIAFLTGRSSNRSAPGTPQRDGSQPAMPRRHSTHCRRKVSSPPSTAVFKRQIRSMRLCRAIGARRSTIAARLTAFLMPTW